MDNLSSKARRRLKILIILAIMILLYMPISTLEIMLGNSKSKSVTASVQKDEDNSQDNNEENIYGIILNSKNCIEDEEIIIMNEDNCILEDFNDIEENENVENENESNTTNVNPSKKYYIAVNYKENVVTIYTYDQEGNYTIPVKAMICSTGTATPQSGVFEIKSRWEWLGLKGGVFGHYCTQITGNILFHSVPYLEKWNPASLEYWEYDKLRYKLFCRLCTTYCY